jgi:hypothetical protein
VRQLLKIFIDICLFRANAEQLPYSFFLMMLCIITYIIAGMALSLINLSLNKAILIVGVDVAMMLSFIYTGLWIRSFFNRAIKTITAIAGTGTLFTVISLPLAMILTNQPKDQASIFSVIYYLLVAIWNVGVLGHILRGALSMPLWVGITIALMYFYVNINVLRVLSLA